MSDTQVTEQLAKPTDKPITKRDLVEKGVDAFDGKKIGGAAASYSAGGVSFASLAEVIEVAKLMAVSDKAVPAHLRNNPGTCLRIVFQAVEWRMSPFAVADKSYLVNDRVSYESQLIHAVIESRAPLQRRLECEYEGSHEDGTRVCIVTGKFTNGDIRDYRSPMIKDIKIKNSPLWHKGGDPDQQFWYYSSRSWARKWCPDVLMGIYSKEELEADPTLGRDDDVDPGLHARLTANGADKSEGYREGHADSELAQIAGAKDGEILPPVEEGKKPKKQKAAKVAPEQEEVEEKKNIELPKDAVEYADYARAWIAKAKNADDLEARWDAERELRLACKVGVSLRKNVERDAYEPKLAELRKAKQR